MANDNLKTEAVITSPPATCWALAAMLTKSQCNGYTTTTTSRMMLGYRRCDSEDEAIGNFLRACLKENEGFQCGDVLSLGIPEAQMPNAAGEPCDK